MARDEISDRQLYEWLGELEYEPEDYDEDYDPEWDNWVKPSEREDYYG